MLNVLAGGKKRKSERTLVLKLLKVSSGSHHGDDLTQIITG